MTCDRADQDFSLFENGPHFSFSHFPDTLSHSAGHVIPQLCMKDTTVPVSAQNEEEGASCRTVDIPRLLSR